MAVILDFQTVNSEWASGKSPFELVKPVSMGHFQEQTANVYWRAFLEQATHISTIRFLVQPDGFIYHTFQATIGMATGNGKMIK